MLHLMKKNMKQKLCNNNKSNKVSFSLIIQPKSTSIEKPLLIILNYKNGMIVKICSVLQKYNNNNSLRIFPRDHSPFIIVKVKIVL